MKSLRCPAVSSTLLNPAIDPSARTLVSAALIADGTGFSAAPGAMLIEGRRVVAVGSPESIGRVGEATRLVLDREAVLPALVNAHTHLDLSHIGPRPYDGDFISWINAVRALRATSSGEEARAIRRGIDLSLAGGVAAVGDIAGVRSLVSHQELSRSPLGGVSFIEVFGVGPRQQLAIDFMRSIAARVGDTPSNCGVRLGLQPHAPYSCGPEVFLEARRLAQSHGIPLSTHLGETLEELRFATDGDGPFAELLQGLGLWDRSMACLGSHPLEALAAAFEGVPWIAAHLNYLPTGGLERLAALPMTVAYCPRASAYFGHPQGSHAPHAYRAMLERGIKVAIGTDSILCLDTPDRLSPLDEVRFLLERDGTDPTVLLGMATVNGALALGLPAAAFSVGHADGVTPLAGLLAIAIASGTRDARGMLADALRSATLPRWLLPPRR